VCDATQAASNPPPQRELHCALLDFQSKVLYVCVYTKVLALIQIIGGALAFDLHMHIMLSSLEKRNANIASAVQFLIQEIIIIKGVAKCSRCSLCALTLRFASAVEFSGEIESLHCAEIFACCYSADVLKLNLSYVWNACSSSDVTVFLYNMMSKLKFIFCDRVTIEQY
jgi:hypothetical protein